MMNPLFLVFMLIVACITYLMQAWMDPVSDPKGGYDAQEANSIMDIAMAEAVADLCVISAPVSNWPTKTVKQIMDDLIRFNVVDIRDRCNILLGNSNYIPLPMVLPAEGLPEYRLHNLINRARFHDARVANADQYIRQGIYLPHADPLVCINKDYPLQCDLP